MARLALGVVGAAVGYYISGGNPAGAQLGWAIGYGVGSYVDQPDVQGPRIQDLNVQVSTYGVPIPIVYGTVRMPGNVIWSTKIIEHANDASGKGGPTMTTYSYTVSCAVALCANQITGIQKVWANNELIYDVTPGNTGNTGAGQYRMTVYTGSETQMPDPRMQAELGAPNVPAYRGLAYVVFEDIPLEKFGNRMPNFNFLVVASGVYSRLPATQLSTIDADAPIYDSQTDTVARLSASGSSVVLYKMGSATAIGTFALPAACNFLVPGEPGTLWAISEGGNAYIVDFGSGTVLQTVLKPSNRVNGCWNEYEGSMVLASSNLGTKITVLLEANNWAYTTYSTVASVNSAWGSCICTPDGYVVLSNGDKICVLDQSYAVVLDYQCPASSSEYVVGVKYSAFDSKRNLVYVSSSNTSHLYVVDYRNRTVTPYAVDAGLSILYHAQSDLLIGVGTGSTPTYKIFDPDNLPNTLDSFNVSSPTTYITGFPVEVDGITDAILVAATGSVAADGLFQVPFWPRLTSSGYPLSSIVSDQCQRAGLTALDIDTGGLTATVNGYLINKQDSARNNLNPLQIAYFFDAVESDDVLKFVSRGGASAVIIPEADLGAYAAGSSAPPLLETVRTDETGLPRTINVNYLNPDVDYQQSTQYERRLTGSANIETTLSLPLVLTDDQAKQIAAVNLYTAWANRGRYTLNTGVKYTGYEPTDIVTATKGNTLTALRVVDKQEGGDGTIVWQAVAEDASVYTQGMAGAAASMPTQTVQTPVQTRLELMDIPLLRDVDNGAGFYFAACGYRSGWQGMELFRSTDGGASWADVATSASEAVIGSAISALGNFSGGCIVDELNSVTVLLANPGLTLAGISLANLLAGGNACLLGSEVLAFRDATLNADGSYTLSGMLRGLRGTAWAMGSHAAGERFVLFSTSSTRRFAADSSEIGLTRKYKGVSVNTTLAQASTQSFTDNAVGLKPYAPAMLGGGRDADGNLTLQWVRCARTGGEWRDYVDADQPEATLAYEVEIWDATWTTLMRTITGLSSETATYAYADYLADFGSAAGGSLDPSSPIINPTLANPGAESGSTTGWTNETGAGGVRTASPAPHAGSYYFFGGTSATTIMSQRVDLLAAGWTAAQLDSGSLGASLTWWQTCYAANNDNGTMGVRFLNASLAALGTDDYAALGQPTTWTQRSKSARMPVGTRYVEILMKAVRQSGTNNDAYFDDVALSTGTLLGNNVNVRVYQVSAAVGRGYKLEGTV